MNPIDIFILIWLHFVADFVLQSDDIAKHKSENNFWLLLHVLVYSLPFYWFGPAFALFNGAAHFVTDYFTSRATKRLWAKGDRHNFFVVIGLDQAIHMSTLIISLWWLKTGCHLHPVSL